MASIISASTTSGTALNMSADTTGVLQLATGATPTTALTIDTSQNVGIGTTSPASKLHVRASSTGSTANGIILDAGAQQHSWYLADNFTSTFSIGSSAGQFTWANSGGERMRIDSSGNLLVNTTSASGSSNTFKSTAGAGAQALSIWNNATSGTRYFLSFATETSSTDRGYITYNGTTVAISQASDERLKENINDAPSALEKINDIKIRSFDWKEDNRHIDYGVIAQELIKIVPSAVFEGVDNEDGSINKYWSVGLEPLIPILTKAIQEQQTIINDLKARIETLESK